MMDKEQEKSNIKDEFVGVALLALIGIRFWAGDKENLFISSIGYIGVLLALFDLYVEICRVFKKNDKFHVINGIAYLNTVPLAILLVLFLTGVIVINEVWNDVFTMLALLISLPKSIYLSWISNFLDRKEYGR